MEDLILALTAHISGSALPLYLADAVPEKTPFPYLTAEVVSPCRPDAKGSLLLTLWCVGDDANPARMELHSAMMQAFPKRGAVLTSSTGRYILQPERSALVQSGAARGVCTTMEIRFYPAKEEADQA